MSLIVHEVAAAEQRVQHGSQHMQAAQRQAPQSTHATQSAAVAQMAHLEQRPSHLHGGYAARRSPQVQHAEQKQTDHLNLLHEVTQQLPDMLVTQSSDEAGPSAYQNAIPTEMNVPGNAVAPDTSALFLCPLTKVMMPLDLSKESLLCL